MPESRSDRAVEPVRRGAAAEETAVILPVFFVLVMYSLQVATVVLF